MALTTKAASAPKTVALTYNGAAVKKAGNFVGDASKVLTLTATDISGTADHHVWTLPTNTHVIEGNPNNDLVLTIDLGAVTKSNDALVFSCASVGGCGSSSKSLSVARAEAGTPKGLNLYDPQSITPTTAIKKLDSYTGTLKGRYLTLTVTPNTTAGSEATSYRWVLPAAATTTATPYVENGTLIPNTYTSTSTSISINLASVGAETAFTFKVYGVNGNGVSLASKDLACTSAAPKAPAAIYAGINTSVTGTKLTTYSPSCGTVTISVPEILGVENDFMIISGGAIIASHELGSNVATIDLSTATSSIVLIIRVTASTATGFIYRDYSIKLGTACSAPTRIAPEEASVTEVFKAIAYPNPSVGVFNIEVSTPSSIKKKDFNVQVYDMTGRFIEQHQVQQSENIQIGSDYATGMYSVIVTQGDQVKTLRMIKK